MINVSKPYLPPIDEYNKLLEKIWNNYHITNNGPLVKELEQQLQAYLNIEHVTFVNNCTTGLQIAIKALEISGEVITTPFTFPATANALLWTGCTPVFVDIDKDSLCIDASKIEMAITDRTTAILATHVFGNPCDVVKIERIAKAKNLKVIYDGAHAFGVNINNKSIFEYGDVSVVSFHANKIFHTVEGGAVITTDADLSERCKLLRNFGIKDNMPVSLGINAKNTELHAAMGLCNLPHVPDFIEKRKLLSAYYKKRLKPLNLQYPKTGLNVDYNYAYFPVIFSTEDILLRIVNALNGVQIYSRRYFYPSLNNLPYYNSFDTPVSKTIAARVLCLPLYYDLTLDDVELITQVIVDNLN
jgi:dTDP-4-amino-4,6-dideoxygalactose transaminase